MSESPLLELEDLSWAEGRRRVIERASLTLGPGEIVGISGPRGAGKNALLQLIVGLRKPGSGRILFDGKDITQTGYVHRQRLGIVSPMAPRSLNWKIQRVFREATIRDCYTAPDRHRQRPSATARRCRGRNRPGGQRLTCAGWSF